MIKYASILKKISGSIALLGGFVLTANALLVIVNIILRRVFNSPIFGSTEYVQYISLIAGSLGLMQNEWFGGNVTMTMLHEHINKKAADALLFAGSLISAAGFTYVSYLMINDTISKFKLGDVTPTLSMPKWIFTAILSLGIMLLTIAIISKAVVRLYGLIKGQDINLRDPEATGSDKDILE